MPKKRVGIYIDEGVWKELHLAALSRSVLEKRSVGVSELVEGLIRSHLDGFKAKVHVVEKATGEKIRKTLKIGEDDRTDAGPNVQVDMAELERINRKIKSKPIVSYSKDRQLGKKGSK